MGKKKAGQQIEKVSGCDVTLIPAFWIRRNIHAKFVLLSSATQDDGDTVSSLMKSA